MNKLLPILLAVVFLSGWSLFGLPECNLSPENCVRANKTCELQPDSCQFKKYECPFNEAKCGYIENQVVRYHNRDRSNEVGANYRPPDKTLWESIRTIFPSNKTYTPPPRTNEKRTVSKKTDTKKVIVIKREKTLEEKVKDLEFEIDMIRLEQLRNE